MTTRTGVVHRGLACALLVLTMGGGSARAAPSQGDASGEPRAAEDARPVILIVVERGRDDHLAARLSLDPGLTRFRIDSRLEEGPFAPDALERTSDRADAVAGVFVARTAGAVTIWLADRITGKVIARRLQGPRDEDETLLALGVVELLRSSLMELRLPNRPSLGTKPPPAAALQLLPQAMPSMQDRWHVMLEGGALGPLGAVGEVGLVPLVVLAVGYQGANPLGARVGVSVPLALPTTTDERGQSTIRALGAHGRVTAAFRRTRALQPHVGIAWHLWQFQVAGRAAFPLESASETKYAYGPAATLGLDLRLSPRWRLSVHAELGAMSGAPRIRFADEVVADWGPYFAQAGLGFGVGF